MRDSASLLYDWRQLRLKLNDNLQEDSLQELTDWFSDLDPSAHGFDYDDMNTWPDIWQYITEGFYTESGNGLGMFYTVAHAEYDPELWLVHDMYHSDIYLVTVVDKYILNRRSGEVELLTNAKKDLNVLEKHSKDKVLQGIKFN